MPTLGLETHIVDREVYARNVAHFREAGIVLPTFHELARPERIPEEIREKLAEVDPDAPDPLNLFRIHWYNGEDPGELCTVPDHLVLPPSLTGVPAPIVLLLADRFPMIHAHKVLATYGCLVPRLITGQFDPGRHRAVWPSTGNYCRGGVAVSRILGCRGVAVLPEGMSRERFDWLEEWVAEPEDVVRTPGTESNVKEIYDRCKVLAKDPANIIFNQFSEFGNHLAHRLCTGSAVARVFDDLSEESPGLELRAFVSATGSAGTLGAGDELKDRYGSLTVAVEALECPTMLYNGFGEHNIQGIGDKHIPLIHNVMGTDFAVAVSDRATDELFLLFNTRTGQRYLAERCGLSPELLDQLPRLGLSSLCNLVASIKLAEYLDLGEEDGIATVATDGAALYTSELDKIERLRFPEGFGPLSAAEVFGRHLLGAATDHLRELTRRDRERIFNLGYYTWVEQQGISLEDFVARRDAGFWDGLLALLPAWDLMITQFNRNTGNRNTGNP
jgi:cysteine synthase A